MMKSFHVQLAPARRLSIAAVALIALAAPGRAQAQAAGATPVTPAALIGTWSRRGDTTAQITFGADSTFTTPVETNQFGYAVGERTSH